MTPQQLIGVGVRLFAVWLVLTSIPYFVAIPGQLSDSPGTTRGAVVFSYAIALAYVLGAVALWLFPLVVASRLLPRTRHTNALSFEPRELARVGCSLLGLWLFAKALPTVAWFIFRAFLIVGSSSSYSALDSQTQLELVVSVSELVFAVLVIAKAGTFSNLVIPGEAKPVSADPDDL